jgi:hypothetical protein
MVQARSFAPDNDKLIIEWQPAQTYGSPSLNYFGQGHLMPLSEPEHEKSQRQSLHKKYERKTMRLKTAAHTSTAKKQFI